MSGDGKKALSPAEAMEFGMQRETWCAVEMKKEQSWNRKNKRHFSQQFSSSVFEVQRSEYEPRCTFKVHAPTHRERKHFGQQFHSQLNI